MLPTPYIQPLAPPADFLVPDNVARVSLLRDLELGSLLVSDPTGGLRQATWEGYLDGQTFKVWIPPSGTITDVLTVTGQVTELSLAFDSNMRPHFAYVEDGVPKFYWYDTSTNQNTITPYPGITSPRLCLDDKRDRQGASRDVLMFYLREGSLYCRQQRDRYLVEYFLQDTEALAIDQVGMAAHNRLRIELVYDAECAEPAPIPQLGLFLIAGRWLLEPDPSRMVVGTLVGQVGDWRLFDTEGEVFLPGAHYNGFATAAGAAWVYEDPEGQKFIATDTSLPLQAGSSLLPVPPEAQAATVGCWFWYAGDQLMGSYTSGDLELRLLDYTDGLWQTSTVALNGDPRFVNNGGFTWTPGVNSGDLSLDGTKLFLRGGEQNATLYGNVDCSMFDIDLTTKQVVTYLPAASELDSWPTGLWHRNTKLYVVPSYQAETVSEWLMYPEGSGSYNQETGQWTIYGPWDYYTYRRDGLTASFLSNRDAVGFPVYRATPVEHFDWTYTEYSSGSYTYTGTIEDRYKQVAPRSYEVGITYEENYDYFSTGAGSQIDKAEDWRFYMRLDSAEIVPMHTDWFFEHASVVSAVTVDLCALFVYLRVTVPGEPFDVDQVQLFAAQDVSIVDLSDLLIDGSEFKAAVVAIASGLDLDTKYSGWENITHETDMIPIPATRPSAF